MNTDNAPRAKQQQPSHQQSASGAIAYLIKGTALFLILLGLRFALPVLPTWAIGIVWAILSAAATVGLAYHVVVKKMHRQMKYRDGGLLARFNSGLAFSLIWRFILSAIFVAGLLISLPKWDVAEWVLMACATPLFLAAKMLVSKFAAHEYREAFSLSNGILATCIVVGLLLCILYALVNFVQPSTTYSSLGSAIAAAYEHLSFENSPSALLAQGGKILALIDGGTLYALSRTAETSAFIYIIWQAALSASAFFGVANLLGSCSLSTNELKQVFVPLSNSANKHAEFAKRAGVLCILPALLFAGCLYADAQVNNAVNSPEGNRIESFIREKANFAVCIIDGKTYDQGSVNNLVSRTKQEINSLTADASQKLIDLVNDSYDKRIANVDSYLDWYYSLWADYSRIGQWITGNAEEAAKSEFESKIEAGIDDSAINDEYQTYLDEFAELKTQLTNQLSTAEIADMPSWLVTETQPISLEVLLSTVEPSQKLTSDGVRLGASAAGGVAAGVLAKIAAKGIFSKLGTKLGTAIGGLGGPIGLAVGVVAGTTIDLALLKADEMANRDAYRQELIDAINESREEALSPLKEAKEGAETSSEQTATSDESSNAIDSSIDAASESSSASNQ